jgi:hypothetical protein
LEQTASTTFLSSSCNSASRNSSHSAAFISSTFLIPQQKQGNVCHQNSLSHYRIEVLFPKFSLCLSLTGICGDPPPPSVAEAIWWSPNGGDHQIASATDVFYQCKSPKVTCSRSHNKHTLPKQTWKQAFSGKLFIM